MRLLQRRIEDLKARPSEAPPLSFGEGGGTYDDDMERRISVLETRADRIEQKLEQINVGLAVLTERVSHLPGKGFIVTATIAGLTFAVTAMGLLVRFVPAIH